jgi:hypothetical protein
VPELTYPFCTRTDKPGPSPPSPQPSSSPSAMAPDWSSPSRARSLTATLQEPTTSPRNYERLGTSTLRQEHERMAGATGMVRRDATPVRSVTFRAITRSAQRLTRSGPVAARSTRRLAWIPRRRRKTAKPGRHTSSRLRVADVRRYSLLPVGGLALDRGTRTRPDLDPLRLLLLRLGNSDLEHAVVVVGLDRLLLDARR